MACEAGLRRRSSAAACAAYKCKRGAWKKRRENMFHHKEAFVLGRPGDDLLSRVLRHSTIGAEAFNGRVRDGIGFFSPRSNHRTGEGQRQGCQGHQPELLVQAQRVFLVEVGALGIGRSRKADRPPPIVRRQPSGRRSAPAPEANSKTMITDSDHESNQANRAISTSQLNASPRLHTWPINVVVFHGSDREHSFQGGFPA